MTALIYKAALPTYTSAEALAANADEALVLNDAGTAYELEPAQSGASVADSRWEGYAENGATLAQGASNVIDFARDSGAGTDIALNANGHTFELGPAGLWLVTVYCYLTPAQGSTALALALAFGANIIGGGVSSMPPAALVSGGGATFTQWIRTNANATFTVTATPLGGSAAEALSSYGASVSIARVA